MFSPKDDGVTHINIYSRGKTPLGRMLSNFALAPFEHPTDGRFLSVEGYWYWLSTDQKHEELRELYGVEAKRFGQQLEPVKVPLFNVFVSIAIRSKIAQNPVIEEALRDSNLPFVHCYVDNKKDEYILLPKHEWQVSLVEEIRKELQCQTYSAS